MKNYIQTLLNLPAILAEKATKADVARLERELLTKASKNAQASDVRTICNTIEIINERLRDRPTHADIVLVKEEIGVRLDLLETGFVEAKGSAANIDVILDPKGKGNVDVSGTKITNVADGVAATDAVNRGQMDAAIAELNAVKTGEPNLGGTGRIGWTSITGDIPAFIADVPASVTMTEVKTTKARKPRAPKGGAK